MKMGLAVFGKYFGIRTVHDVALSESKTHHHENWIDDIRGNVFGTSSVHESEQ
jgi:hypothetical protein